MLTSCGLLIRSAVWQFDPLPKALGLLFRRWRSDEGRDRVTGREGFLQRFVMIAMVMQLSLQRSDRIGVLRFRIRVGEVFLIALHGESPG
ncbi:hypothetical protein ARC02_15915 [Stenotrophomonas africana]|nr:hypothetical protein ARC02_15915 [Stenotrophomonas maltophilia]